MEKSADKNGFDYELSLELRDSLKKRYPFLVCHPIGKSVCGREILGYSVGNYKNVVLFAGGFRGKDKMTSLVLYKYIESVCNAVKNKRRLAGVNVYSSLVLKGVTVIPCLNPDGIEIAEHGSESAGEYSEYVKKISENDFSCWNANAKGIDISRNFSSGWEKLHQLETEKGIFGPSSSNYSGFAPESEPETTALVKFCERNNVHHAFSLVNSAEGINWDYDGKLPENSRTMAKILSVCSGYKLMRGDNENNYGSFKNWFVENFSRSAFSIQLNADEEVNADEVYSKLEEMLVIGTII